MKNIIAISPEAFNPNFVDYIHGVAENFSPGDAVIGATEDTGRVDSDYRRSEIRWLPDWDERVLPIVNAIMWHAKKANREFFGFDIDFLQDIQYTTYKSENQGKYDWHHDTFWAGPTSYDRKISFICQLSDPSEYTGGEFEIDHQYEMLDQEMVKKKGTVIIFPSFIRHRVTPVTSGVRKSLVSWVEGPKFR